ncbi:MFS transporter [Streptomyces sp. V3I7]|uniref:MFS transporter n=1 Tax=Streptomyces sp. V3I7 TaxID=3042278 RepID=UPI00277F2E70|nr:MFS transporter [Streptomyces sp. V3I7]MDQ0994604.1 MFS family permease [Streptomyces sp. V3I7]
MPASRSPRSWLPAAAAVSAAAWGANQFTPLAVIYRMQAHWAALPVAGMFTAYLFGLVPGLLLGGPASVRYGRRRVVRAALILTAVASLVLAAAVASQHIVYVSRLATGVAAGLVFTAGGAWVRELSATPKRPQAGARRVLYATGGGFSAGALVTGALAEWFPHPMELPGLVHAGLSLIVLLATGFVPDTEPPAQPVPSPFRALAQRRAAVRHPRFLRVVLPASPAVFGAATVAYVVLPPLVSNRVPGYAPLFSGLMAALTLTTGIVVQPLGRRLDDAGSARGTVTALSTVIAGLLISAFAAHWNSARLAIAAAVVLGAGYGLTLVSGMKEIERLAPAPGWPSASSLYQSTTSSGFLTPLLLAVTAAAAPYPALLVALAAVALLCLTIAARHSRRNLPVLRPKAELVRTGAARPAVVGVPTSDPEPGPGEAHEPAETAETSSARNTSAQNNDTRSE